MFLGVYESPTSDKKFFIETTMLGDKSFVWNGDILDTKNPLKEDFDRALARSKAEYLQYKEQGTVSLIATSTSSANSASSPFLALSE